MLFRGFKCYCSMILNSSARRTPSLKVMQNTRCYVGLEKLHLVGAFICVYDVPYSVLRDAVGC